MREMAPMITEYIDSIVTLVVGTTAFIVYWMTKSHEKRNAATMIIMDIRHAEQVIQSILEKGSIDTFMKDVITENNWSKYKHLFASKFSQDDFASFNRFFDSCVDISVARSKMLDVFHAGLCAKAEKVQQMLLDIENPSSPEGQQKRDRVISHICTEVFVFDPDDPKARIYRGLQLMGRLSNTVAFEKLKKIAGINA